MLIGPEALDLEKADAPRRVMAAAFAWVGSRTYRPRFEQLLETVAQARKGATVTLGGCIISPAEGGTVRLMREVAATKPVIRASDSVAKGVFWDQHVCVCVCLCGGESTCLEHEKRVGRGKPTEQCGCGGGFVHIL